MSDEFDDPVRPGIAASILNALENRRALAPRRPGVGIAMFVAVVVIFASVVWYSYPREAAQQNADIPIVKAEAGPYKAAPDEPGGMDIPYRDSTVFDTLRASNESGEQVEHLLPPAEQPLPHEQVFAGLKTDVKDLPGTTGQADQQAAQQPDQQTPVTAAPVPEAKRDISPISPQPEAKPAAKPDSKTTETQIGQGKPVKPESVSPASGVETTEGKGGYYAQLGSMRSQKDAESTWAHMKKAYSGLFGSAPYQIQKADLGAKGTYYRLQAGPVTEAKAREICDGVGGKKGGCLVIKR